jgi:hypothetical protein
MGRSPDPRDPTIPPEQEVSPGEDEEGTGEISIERIQVINLFLVAGASLLALLISVRFALGVLSGGLLMAVNFRILTGVVRTVFVKGAPSFVGAGMYWLKFLAMLVLVGVFVLVFRIDAIGFLVGLSTILVAITAEAVMRLTLR